MVGLWKGGWIRNSSTVVGCCGVVVVGISLADVVVVGSGCGSGLVVGLSWINASAA